MGDTLSERSQHLSHLDEHGAARMVDVSAKPETDRVAVAGCRVLLAPETLELLAAGGLPKGDALAVARVAGIMGAKRTPELIPLCHPLPITGVEVDLAVEADAVRVTATVRTTGRSGVEMEALTAAATAALALYDMVKGVQRDVRIDGLRLLAKRGGRSGEYTAPGGVWPGGVRGNPEGSPGESDGSSGEVPR
jgi:cyclic pyranopterin phosphate synthase